MHNWCAASDTALCTSGSSGITLKEIHESRTSTATVEICAFVELRRRCADLPEGDDWRVCA